MEEKDFLKQLVDRFANNTATEEEVALFFHLMNEGKLDTYLQQAMGAESKDEDPVLIIDEPQKSYQLNRYWYMAAACVLLAFSGVAYMFWKPSATLKNEQQSQIASNIINDILPGGDKAILTLADGNTIILDSAGNGSIAQQGNTKVIKNGGQLTYEVTEGDAVVLHNAISTPKGGQYKIVLPDGSLVWLNAASSLKFPTVFSEKERTVELSGEAYFEITTKYVGNGKDKLPFYVKINNAEVEVLGTHFNVMAYNDEQSINTTLLEGSVRVYNNGEYAMLKPGQQARIGEDSKHIVVNEVDVTEVVAWKNGYFKFTNTNITTIMRQAARWYNVDVSYEGQVEKESFSGAIPRMQSLSALLKVLELTKTVKFSVEGNRVIVKPY